MAAVVVRSTDEGSLAEGAAAVREAVKALQGLRCRVVCPDYAVGSLMRGGAAALRDIESSTGARVQVGGRSERGEGEAGAADADMAPREIVVQGDSEE